jgi:hypothetical protein
LAASGTQVWLDDQAMRASGVTRQAIVTFLQGLKVDGRPFYRLVLDASVIEQERARWIASHAR